MKVKLWYIDKDTNKIKILDAELTFNNSDYNGCWWWFIVNVCCEDKEMIDNYREDTNNKNWEAFSVDEFREWLKEFRKKIPNLI